MNQQVEKIKWQIFSLIVLEFFIIVIYGFIFKANVIFPLVIVILEGVIVYYLINIFRNELNNFNHSVKEYLGKRYRDIFLYGEVGIVMYNDNYVITFMSDLFTDRNIDRVGTKILSWLPEVDDLISGRSESARISLDEHLYEVTRKDDEACLLFKDITNEHFYDNAYKNEQLVIGLFNLDNYEESTMYEDELEVSNINSALRTPVVEYAKSFGIMLKRMNNFRYLAVLNEQIYQQLVEDKFSIMARIRKEASKLDVPITLSMSFARGSSNIIELDETSVQLLDLAQSRGGDQVVTKKIGEDVKYFGGSSEALEKRSRVRVRVMANTIRELIQKSSNVIICGHKMADFDCIGAAIGVSRLVECYHKQVCIIEKTGGVEEKLKECLEKNKEALKDRVLFVSENEALNQLRDTTLVIMVDHHSLSQSNGQQVLERANRIAIIDHHRRSADLNVQPMLVYIESAASSTSELVSEFIPYVSNRLDISEVEATIMLAGMTVDTNYFRQRTGTRTYDAASSLRKLGANPIMVDEYLKDTYEEMQIKNLIMSSANIYRDGIAICDVDNKIISRSLIAQGADRMLTIKNIHAAFVIAKTDEDYTSISARSDGTINVQIIMEKMQGGGHLTGAALQRKNSNVQLLKEELSKEIDNYLKERENESNIEK